MGLLRNLFTALHRVLTVLGYPVIVAIHMTVSMEFNYQAIVLWGPRLLYFVCPFTIAVQIMLYHNLHGSSDCWGIAAFDCWSLLGWRQIMISWCVVLPIYYAGIGTWVVGSMHQLPRHTNRLWRAHNTDPSLFKGKRVVIIGNGPSAMSDPPMGALIDQFDEIVRFNNFNAGGKYAKYVGSRTTVHFSDGMLFPSYDEYKQDEEVTTILSLLVDRISIGVTYYLLRGAIDMHPITAYNFLMNPSVWWTPSSQIEGLRQKLGIDRHQQAPTSGMLAINMFTQMEGVEVYIHGFDFFMDPSKPTAAHYQGGARTRSKQLHYYDEDEPLYERFNDNIGVNFHQPTSERPLVAEWVRDGRVKFLPGSKDTIYAVIPARSGSTGVPGKNVKDFCGKPLLAWAVEAALKAEMISRVFVSTDSVEYQQVALAAGAECPFLRPANISHGTSTDLECFTHFLEWLKEKEGDGALPDYVVQLRPTAPLVKASAVDAAAKWMLRHELMDYDSLRSVTAYDHEAYNSYWMQEDGLTLKPLIQHRDIAPWRPLPSEPQSVARQILPGIYWHNAYIDIVRKDTVLGLKTMLGSRCLSYMMQPEDNADIDTPQQWSDAERRKRAEIAAGNGQK
jgi:N-acylneuraminate cytidylyltransferase